MLKETILSILLALVLSTMFGGLAVAQETPPTGLGTLPTGPQSGSSFVSLLENITDWIFVLFLIGAVILILLAGWQFITAGGDPTGIAQARRKLLYAAIGIAVAVMAGGIPVVVNNVVGGNGSVSSSVKRVFVTSVAGLDGLSAGSGDSVCNFQASIAGLGGSWVAWLSTTSVDARDKIGDFRYERVDGVLIANNKADLLDGTLANPIDVDENGSIVFPVIAWTGTLADGTASPTNCNNWSSASGGLTGLVGSGPWVTSFWTEDSPITPCTLGTRLYCFEQ